MARITVDDCLKQIPNRFEMSLAATYRARQITNGAQPMLEANRDKADRHRAARACCFQVRPRNSEQGAAMRYDG